MEISIPPGFETAIRRVEQLEAQRQRDPRAIFQLIQVYEQMVERLQPDKAPSFYGTIQNNLGNAYLELPTGDRATNLEQAIRCYQEALRFWTPETAPLDYARVQTRLGLAYYELSTGDRSANLEQAIRCFQEALRFRTPESCSPRLRQDSEQPGYCLLRAADRGPGRQPGAGHPLFPARLCASGRRRLLPSTTPPPRTAWATPTRVY